MFVVWFFFSILRCVNLFFLAVGTQQLGSVVINLIALLSCIIEGDEMLSDPRCIKEDL